MNAGPADPEVHPPSWCLPAAALLALAALAPFVPGFVAAEHAQKSADRALAGLGPAAEGRAANPAGLEPVRIFAIGDSVLRSAVTSDDDMRRDGRAYGLDLTWQLLGHGGLRWDSATVVETAAAAQPDLLIVDSTKLFYTPQWPEPPPTPLLLYPLEVPDPPSLGVRFLRHVRRALRPRVDASARYRAHQARLDRVYAPPDPRYLRAFDAARRRGADVVLVEIPLHPEARSAFAPRHETTRWLRTLEADGALTVWRCGWLFTADDFRDFRHLSERGRLRYSRWLLERLREWRNAHPRSPESPVAAGP